MTKAQESHILEAAAKWQKVLRLSDWVLEVAFKRRHEMSSGSNLGECTYNIQEKRCIISLLHPKDIEAFKEEYKTCNCNLEVTLLHEFMELMFAGMLPDDIDTVHHLLKEQACNLLSEAFYSLKYEGKDD